MAGENNYHDYPLGRSVLGFLYRKWVLFPRLNRSLNGKILDFGCGIGDFLAYRKDAVGVDVNSDNVTYCQAQGLLAELIVDEQIPFPDHFFDSVVMDNVLEHIASDQVDCVVQEVMRVLDERGSILIGVPGEKGYASDDDHKCFYDENSLPLLMQGFGFTHQETLHMPFYFPGIGKRMRQYCLYMLFLRI